MNLVEVNIHNLDIIHRLAGMHYTAYHEKFTGGISVNIEDYIKSTIDDVLLRRVYVDSEFRGLIVLEDRTDKLIHNSTYHLVTRIYVPLEYRGRGIAKEMINKCHRLLGTLMGYNGRFYKIKDNL